MLHELCDFDGVVVFMIAMYGETDRTDKSSVFAVTIDADEGRVLLVRVAGVGLDELVELA